jgi:hypothetical protein
MAVQRVPGDDQSAVVADADGVDVRMNETSGRLNWEFVDEPPTIEQVQALLESCPPVWGIPMMAVIDYVQAMPATMTTKIRDEHGRKIAQTHDVWRLYVSVAGRVHQCRLAAEKHGWRVDYEPEPGVPVPGMLRSDDRIVYREYVTIYVPPEDSRFAEKLLGRKPGTAWVPSSGGKQAAGTNPYEKVETSARGRALAAWGFGVLPGSGIASLEEMQSGSRAMPDQGPHPEDESQEPADLLGDTLTMIEKVRQARGKTPEQMYTEIVAYAHKTFGADIAGEKDDTGAVTSLNLTVLKRGQVMLLGNALKQTLQAIQKEEPAL